MSTGCNSGHFVNGVPRRQASSIISFIVFLGTAIGMATYRYNHPFMEKGNIVTEAIQEKLQWMSQGLAFFMSTYFVIKLFRSIGSALFIEYVITYLIGLVFGVGLLISGMLRPSKVYAMMTLDYKIWDPALLIMFGVCLLINKIFAPMLDGRKRPLLVPEFNEEPTADVNGRLITGAAIFGLGLGLTGLFPGPGMVDFFTMSYAIFWIVGFAMGELGYDFFNKKVLIPSEKASRHVQRERKAGKVE